MYKKEWSSNLLVLRNVASVEMCVSDPKIKNISKSSDQNKVLLQSSVLLV